MDNKVQGNDNQQLYEFEMFSLTFVVKNMICVHQISHSLNDAAWVFYKEEMALSEKVCNTFQYYRPFYKMAVH